MQTHPTSPETQVLLERAMEIGPQPQCKLIVNMLAEAMAVLTSNIWDTDDVASVRADITQISTLMIWMIPLVMAAMED